MIQKIKKQIEEHLENIITPINYHVLLQKINFELSGILKYHVNNMNICDFKVICDNTNNTDKKNINVDVYIKERRYFEIKVLTFSMLNNNSIMKNIRKKKLEKIDIISKIQD